LKPRSTWKQIGQGATAVVYLTESRTFPVVVKEIVAEVTNEQQFVAQLNVVLSLKHPNIVAVSRFISFSISFLSSFLLPVVSVSVFPFFFLPFPSLF